MQIEATGNTIEEAKAVLDQRIAEKAPDMVPLGPPQRFGNFELGYKLVQEMAKAG